MNAEELQQLQREVERTSEQTKMDWENGRRQMEQYQEEVARYSRKLEEVSDAFREAHERARDISNDIGGPFFVSLINWPGEPSLIHVTVLGWSVW